MPIRVGVNGFGRIGRLACRHMFGLPGRFEVLAINDLVDAETNANLLRHDTVFRQFPGTVAVENQALMVNGQSVLVFREKDPERVPWGSLGVDFVVESSGAFDERADLEKHLAVGAPRVLLSAPAASRDDVDITVVLGVNHDRVTKQHRLISLGSCTTNCLAPIAKVLHDRFGIIRGRMTTIHAMTNDQRTADQAHRDPRRARAASGNIIPTSTGAAKAIGLVLPELDGKISGVARRVPVIDGSVVDLSVDLRELTTPIEINQVMCAAAQNSFRGIIEFSEDPIVSSDVIGRSCSALFDSLLTSIANGQHHVTAWYDNEWAYARRIIDLMEYLVTGSWERG